MVSNKKLKMKIILILCTMASLSDGNAQIMDGFFNQKKTKLKYIEQQIAAFEVYAGYLKKGYAIVQQGWNTIDDIKHGDFDLHNNYFNSLAQVNSSISGDDKVDAIIGMQQGILQVNNAIKKLMRDNDNIQAEEKDYIGKVMTHLLAGCADNMDQLKKLTSNDSLSMKDDERLKRIDNLFIDMQDKYSFAKYFQSSIQTLALSRAKESNDVNTAELLYDIK
jgi:hypothetical protein